MGWSREYQKGNWIPRAIWIVDVLGGGFKYFFFTPTWGR